MRKLLSLFGAIGLVATSSATVVSCGDSDYTTKNLKDLEVTGLDAESVTKAIEAKLELKNEGDYSSTVMIFASEDDADAYKDAAASMDENAEPDLPDMVSTLTAGTSYYYIAAEINEKAIADAVAKDPKNAEDAAKDNTRAFEGDLTVKLAA